MGLFGKKKTPEELLAEGRALYEQGNYSKAAEILLKARGKLNGEVEYWLGRTCLALSEEKPDGTYKKSGEQFLKQAAEAGYTGPDMTDDEIFNSGLTSYNAKRYAEALYLWEKAAGLGNAAAQYNIGYMYHAGEGTAKNESKAFYWYRKAAESGHPSGQYNTGVYYLYGVETPVDKQEALKWFRLAAEQGDESAKKQLEELVPQPQSEPKPQPESQPTQPPADEPAKEPTEEELYQKGMELFRAGNYEGAYDLLRRVCRAFGTQKNKYPDGQAAMGWMYEHGCGTEAKDISAHIHYRIAARNGNKDGMAGIVRMTVEKELPSAEECETALEYVKQLDTIEAKAAIPALEKKLAVAKLREKYAELELTEGNVQAIFNRCLWNKDTTATARAQLFLINMGYDGNEDVPIYFDKALLLKNKRNIEYLYGQLYSVHAGTHFTEDQSIENLSKTYMGNYWTRDQACVLMLLYLGATSELPMNIPFSKERNNTTRISRHITPNLSPKDPAFPAWWEEHKSEWEMAENAPKSDEKFALEERLENSKNLFEAGKYKEASQMAGSVNIFVLNDECMGASECGICEDVCKERAITIDRVSDIVSIDNKKCTKCGECVEACPMGAIDIQ